MTSETIAPSGRIRPVRASLSTIVRTTCLSFIGFLLLLLGAVLVSTYLAAMDEGERAAADLTRTAESQLLRILEQADLLLFEQRDIARSTRWNDPAQVAAVNERLAQRAQVLPYVFRLVIFGPDAATLAKSDAGAPGQGAVGRDYFTAQQSADRGLFVSKVLRSRTTGEPIIVFSRRISGADGGFLGIVTVSFALDSLADFFRKLPTKYPSVLQLIDSDMTVLVTSIPWPIAEGEAIGPVMHKAMENDKSGATTYVARDGVERIFAFRRVAPYPLFVRAGIEKAEVVSEWWWRTVPYVVFGALALACLSALSVFALQRARNEERFGTALADVNSLLEQRVRERTESLEEANQQLGSAITDVHEKSRTLETINRINATIAGEMDLERLVQTVTDAATEITDAAFGAFFYNEASDEDGGSYAPYTISGVPRQALSTFSMPRNNEIFHAVFEGAGMVRSDDITQDPRYRSDLSNGVANGNISARSYLAVPVVSRDGGVIGGLFFGHPERGKFTQQDEDIVGAIAAQAAIAYDKGQLYRDAQDEIVRRSESQLALSLSEARFRHLADAMPQIVLTARPDGRPDYYNRKWYSYTGLPDGVVVSWRDILHPDDKAHTREEWMNSVRTGEPCEVEYRLREAAGTYRWHLGRALPIRDAVGAITHWFATCTDIDDLKRAEADLEHHRDELAHQADRLRQALEDREILFKEVHHRVKNNLQVICSLIRLQANRIADADGRSALDDTYNRIYSIGLVHEVLYGEQEAADLDIPAYLGRLCAMLSRVYAASDRGIAVGVEANGSLDLVRAVPVGLLVNELVSNALKHAFPNGRPGRVWLQFHAGESYELVVGDDGIGMPANTGQVGNLGTTIITALVRQLGGTLTRDNGPGTVSRVTFPA